MYGNLLRGIDNLTWTTRLINNSSLFSLEKIMYKNCNFEPFCSLVLTFRYSEKATKIWPIFHLEFDATISNVKKRVEEWPKKFGLLRICEQRPQTTFLDGKPPRPVIFCRQSM